MTKLITAAILIVVLYVAYHVFVYWEQVRDQKEAQQAEARKVIQPESLSGMPSQLENSLQAAQRAGINSFRKWLDTYGPSLQDPRKAWIELDYCLLLSRDNPKEARRVFAGVKQRVKPDSPVYRRVKELEATYEP
jgi:hypothetical protein